jgi:hypothetical protein
MAIETSATQQSRRPRHNPENNNPIDNGRENLHSITQLSEVGARVLAMVEEQAKPLPNIYDNDNFYHGGKYEI